jgi:hypothetical protein
VVVFAEVEVVGGAVVATRLDDAVPPSSPHDAITSAAAAETKMPIDRFMTSTVRIGVEPRQGLLKHDHVAVTFGPGAAYSAQQMLEMKRGSHLPAPTLASEGTGCAEDAHRLLTRGLRGQQEEKSDERLGNDRHNR